MSKILPPARISVPQTSAPSLPASSGAVWGRATTILRKDRQFVEAHTEYVNARAAQATAATLLINNRHALALALARLASLQDIAEHEYATGRADRQHERKMQATRHQIAEINEMIALINSQQSLDRLQQPPPEAETLQPPPEAETQEPPSSPQLTIDDIERVAQLLPELRAETVQALVLSLKGLLREKSS